MQACVHRACCTGLALCELSKQLSDLIVATKKESSVYGVEELGESVTCSLSKGGGRRSCVFTSEGTCLLAVHSHQVASLLETQGL